MKQKKLYLLLLLAFGCRMLTSCDIHTSDNGDLDGFWHLVKADTLSTGGCCDLSGQRVFWGIQASLIEAVDYDNDSTDYGYLFNFEKDATYLRLYNAHRHKREVGDVLVENAADLSSLGVNSLDEKFRIITLDNSRMVLENELLRLQFKKH